MVSHPEHFPYDLIRSSELGRRQDHNWSRGTGEELVGLYLSGGLEGPQGSRGRPSGEECRL